MFIAGEPDHQQPLFINQWMFLGIRGAVDLSWKLIYPIDCLATDSGLVEADGEAFTGIRQEIMPPHSQGFLYYAWGKIAGTLFPQPWIKISSSPKFFDETAGTEW